MNYKTTPHLRNPVFSLSPICLNWGKAILKIKIKKIDINNKNNFNSKMFKKMNKKITLIKMMINNKNNKFYIKNGVENKEITSGMKLKKMNKTIIIHIKKKKEIKVSSKKTNPMQFLTSKKINPWS